MYETYDFVSGYDSVVATNYGYHCISIVLTRAKSEFRVMDSYYISKEHGFALNRKVTVIKPEGEMQVMNHHTCLKTVVIYKVLMTLVSLSLDTI